MNGKQLKNSILQLAIQGKLVPQDPNEEPSSKLLERIRKEKEQLVKEGKLKKKDLVSEPIADEEKPFEIPESWEWCRMKDIVYNNGQKTPDKVFSYIDIGSIDNKNQKLNDQENLIEAKNAPSRARKIVKLRDIVYSTVRPYLHNVAIIDRQFSAEPIASTGFAVLSSIIIYNKYLFYFLLSPQFDEYANNGDNAKGIAYPAINDDKLYKACIPLPPLSEQHRIVAKIEELMPLVEEYDQAQTKLNDLNEKLPDALKKSILQEAIQGKLVPQDPNDEPSSKLLERIRKEKEQLVKEGKLKKKDLVSEPIADEEKPFEIPEGWVWCRLKEVFTMQAGKNINASELSQEKNETHEYLCYGGNGIRGYIGKYNYDGVYPIVGRQGALCGCVNMANGKFQATEHAVVVTTYAKTNELWAYYFLIACKLNQYATATAQPGLSVANILETLIPLPPLSEQHRIVAKIEELFGTLK